MHRAQYLSLMLTQVYTDIDWPLEERGLHAMLDDTTDPTIRSWVPSANGHADFPLQNLPLGIFRLADGPARAGTAIGDRILDLAAVAATPGMLPDDALNDALARPTLNRLMALGAPARRTLRARLFALLTEGASHNDTLATMLHPAVDCEVLLPADIGDYTDFYVGIHHATHVGKLLRPDEPLLPNYKWMPIGYHGRASSVRASGGAIPRPRGQRKHPDERTPTFGPCRRLDYELELGIWLGPGNAAGIPVPIARAHEQVAGFCLLNDWSARDVQGWEYQPLGPFLAKSFATTVSPWIVTPEALAPFRMAQPPRPDGDPAPLDYLLDADDQQDGALDIELEVLLSTTGMRRDRLAPQRLSIGSTRHLYWTVAQMIAHHTSNGCNLRPGDLFGSGTISAPERAGFGSLLEISAGGREPFELSNGETRMFLEDGDEVILRARAHRDGAVSIGFGECRGRVTG